MKVVGRERTEKIRNKEKIIINLTFVLSVYAMAEGHVPWVPEVFLACGGNLEKPLAPRVRDT